jgi:hypothetical protein
MATPLSQWILKIIRSERHGGRTLHTDENTVVLYDCGVWTDEHTRLVHSKYPECEVVVMQSNASLSGFIVVFKLQTDRSVHTWVTVVVLAVALFLITARQIMSVDMMI